MIDHSEEKDAYSSLFSYQSFTKVEKDLVKNEKILHNGGNKLI